MNIKIRKATGLDKQALIELFNQFGDYFTKIDNLKMIVRPSNYGEFYYEEMIKNTLNKGIVYLAEVDGEGVGFAAGNITEIKPATSPESLPQRKGRVIELFVNKEFRGRGVGKMLMEKIENYLIENGCHTINIEVFAPNIKAYDFYQKLGYKDRNIDLMKVIKKPRSGVHDTVRKIVGFIQSLVK